MNRQQRRAQARGQHGDGGADDRMHLLLTKQGAAQDVAQHFAADGFDVREGVLVIVDTRDPFGRALIRAVYPEDMAELDAIAEGGEIPTFIGWIRRDVVVAAVSVVGQEVANRIAQQPYDGHCWLCVFAAGGVTLVHHPVPAAQMPIGEA